MFSSPKQIIIFDLWKYEIRANSAEQSYDLHGNRQFLRHSNNGVFTVYRCFVINHLKLVKFLMSQIHSGIDGKRKKEKNWQTSIISLWNPSKTPSKRLTRKFPVDSRAQSKMSKRTERSASWNKNCLADNERTIWPTFAHFHVVFFYNLILFGHTFNVPSVSSWWRFDLNPKPSNPPWIESSNP